MCKVYTWSNQQCSTVNSSEDIVAFLFCSIYRLCPLREYKKGLYQIQPVISENYFSTLVVKLSCFSKVRDEDKCLKETSLHIFFLDMNFHNQTVRLLHFNQIMNTLQNLAKFRDSKTTHHQNQIHEKLVEPEHAFTRRCPIAVLVICGTIKKIICCTKTSIRKSKCITYNGFKFVRHFKNIYQYVDIQWLLRCGCGWG